MTLMPRKSDTHHSILIVSDSERFLTIVKKSLSGFITIDIRKSASAARRSVLERYYNLVVLDTPLPDELGDGLAIDIAEKQNTGVLVVTPQELLEDFMEQLTDTGILVLSKSMPIAYIDKAVRYLVSIQDRMLELEKKTHRVEEKLEEQRLLCKAKILLAKKKGMTEDEAHRYIGKMAMNNGVSRKKIAEELLEDL